MPVVTFRDGSRIEILGGNSILPPGEYGMICGFANWVREIDAFGDGPWMKVTTTPRVWPLRHVVALAELADSAKEALDVLAPQPDNTDH